VTDEVRPEIVDQVIDILTDDGLSQDVRLELVENSSATAAERFAAAQRFSQMCVNAIIESKMARPSAQPSILDATLGQLQRLAAAYGVLAQWDLVLTKPHMSLGNALKLIPADEAESIVGLLRGGGMLS
jgi:hypothetical protein